ncbi:MAG: hypothetical protein ACXWEY_01490 [Bacteroidia bacterium]
MSTILKVKAIIFLLLAMLLFMIPAKAQFTDDPTKTPDERAQILTNWMQENLKLTDGQLKSIKAINTTAANQMEAAKKEFAGNAQGLLDRGKEIEKEHNIKLRSALNPMQWSKYQKYRDGTLMGKDRKRKKDKTADEGVVAE